MEVIFEFISKEVLLVTADNEASEFGGAPGLIQPSPHDSGTVAREAAFLERACDPGDLLDSPGAVLADVLSGNYPRVPPATPAEILPLAPDVLLVTTMDSTGGFTFVGVGNIDLRTARLKVSTSPTMYPATFGPEKEIVPSIAPVVLLVAPVASGHYFYQILMNNLQVSEVWEVDVA